MTEGLEERVERLEAVVAKLQEEQRRDSSLEPDSPAFLHGLIRGDTLALLGEVAAVRDSLAELRTEHEAIRAAEHAVRLAELREHQLAARNKILDAVDQAEKTLIDKVQTQNVQLADVKVALLRLLERIPEVPG